MDPLTLFNTFAALSKIAFGVSATLVKFVLETRHVDQSLKDLAGEVQSFNAVLEEVGTALTGSSILRQFPLTAGPGRFDEAQKLWTTVCGALTECQVTVFQISSILDRLGKKKTDWAGLAIRQLKLNLRKDEIVSLRRKLQVNSAALQTVLQLLSIRSLFKGQTAIAVLGSRIDQLQTSVDLFIALKSRAPKSVHVSKPSNRYQLDQTDKLSELAVEYILEAKSIYSASIAGSVCEEEVITPQRRLELTNWVQTIPASLMDKETQPESPTERPRKRSSTIDEMSSEEIMNDAHDFSRSGSYLDINQEDKFHAGRVQTLFHGAIEMFLLGAYETTFPALRVVKQNFKLLPVNRRDPMMTKDLDMMAAIIEYHFGRLNRAVSLFQRLLRQEIVDDEDALRASQALHILSHICLLEANPKQAELYCQRAVRERRRILKKDHEDYLDSLWLLSGIYKIMNRHEMNIALRNQVTWYSADTERGQFPFRIDWQLTWNNSGRHEFVDVNPLAPGHRKLPGQSFSGALCALSPCGNVGIYSTGDGVEIRSARNGNWSRSVIELSSKLASASFSSDGRLFSVGSHDGTISIYDTHTGTLRLGYSENCCTSKVAFSQRGKKIAYGVHSSVKVRGSTTNIHYMILEQICGEASEILFSSDDQILAVGVRSIDPLLQEYKQEAGVYLFDLQSGQIIANINSYALHGKISALKFSEDTHLVASASGNRISTWNALTGSTYGFTMEDCGTVLNLALYVEHELLVSRTAKSVTIWNFRTGTQHFRWSKVRDSTGALFTKKVLIYPDNMDSKPYQAHKKGQGISGSKLVAARLPLPSY